MAGKCSCDCDEACDFCFYYDFNGRDGGYYTGHGACWHPEHPCQADPGDGCSDFHCRFRKPSGKTADELSGKGGDCHG